MAMGGVLLAREDGNANESYPTIVNYQLERDFLIMAYAEIIKIKAYADAVSASIHSRDTEAAGRLRDPRVLPLPRLDSDAAWVAFVIGYRAEDGSREWEAHFVNDVLPCEGSRWIGYYGFPFWGRAQFSSIPGDTWDKVLRHFEISPEQQRSFADSPFQMGRAVAWWSNRLAETGSHPGTRGGWPVCWWQGRVP